MRTLTAFLSAIIVITLVSRASASFYAYDDATQSTYNDGWQTGDNGGFGWGTGWTLVEPGSPTFSGHYVGSSSGNGGSPNIDTSSKAWGMYANTNNLAESSRSFNGDMTVGQTFSIDMDNGDVPSGGSVGFSLRNASSGNRFEFYFAGGNSDYFVADNSSQTRDSGIPWSDGGIHIAFTLTGTDTYSISFKRLNNNQTNTFSGTLEGTAGSGVQIFRAFDFNPSSGGSTRDLFFNSMQVPEPASLSLLALGMLPMLRRRR